MALGQQGVVRSTLLKLASYGVELWLAYTYIRTSTACTVDAIHPRAAAHKREASAANTNTMQEALVDGMTFRMNLGFGLTVNNGVDWAWQERE